MLVSVFIKIKSSVSDSGEKARKEPAHPVPGVDVKRGEFGAEHSNPLISLDGAMARIETVTDQLPPWKRPRAVVESNGEAFKGQVSSSEYPALKKRLVSIPTHSAHSRQSLYRDKYTGQFWLGLKACMGSWSQQIEVLKPLGYDVAESLSAPSRSLSEMMVH